MAGRRHLVGLPEVPVVGELQRLLRDQLGGRTALLVGGRHNPWPSERSGETKAKKFEELGRLMSKTMQACLSILGMDLLLERFK